MTNGPDESSATKDGNKKESTLGWAWRWRGRVSKLNRVWQWASSLLQTPAGAVVAVGSAGAVAVGAVAIADPDLAARLGLRSAPSQPVEVKTVRWSDNAMVFPIHGIDKSGRKANFDMVLISSDYAWGRGSADHLTKAGAILTGEDITTQIFRAEITQGLGLSSDIIAVGAASAEGDRKTETKRAEARARTLAGWIGAAGLTGRQIWTLNLGQFETACATAGGKTDTAWQRPFIMVGVTSKQGDVRLDEALSNAMSGKANLPSPTCYSSFALDKVK